MTETRKKGKRGKAPKPPLDADLTLLDWGPRGASLAELAGEKVVIDRGIPGEHVGALVQRGRRPRRGVVTVVQQPSPTRVAAPCPYYLAGCGGCQWQHLSYDAQLQRKRDVVDAEMRAMEVDARVERVHAMHVPWRYRRTAAIALGWEAGFRRRGRRGIVEIHDCLIAHPLMGRFAHALNGLLRDGTLPNYHGRVFLDCTVVGSECHPSLQVLIQGIQGLTIDSNPELPGVASVLAAQEGVISVAFRHRSGEAVALQGDLLSPIEVAGRNMYVPIGAFFQTNVRMLEMLMERMQGTIADLEVHTAADIYGGVGTLGLPLASRVKRLALIELDSQAVDAARRTAREWRLTNVDFISDHAEKALPRLPSLDLAIVDPPRSGLGDRVVTSLIESAVPTVLYVSCSPQSLARDLAGLEAGGFSDRSLEIFDFYSQTYHVESLAVLRR